METVDTQVLNACLDWAKNGQRFALITVLRTWGSSPRPPGAWMAINEQGLVHGSVSGGCIEDDLILRARSGEIFQGQCRSIIYGVSAEEARRFGLPCGGNLELLLEPQPNVSQLKALSELTHQGRLVLRHVNTQDNTSYVDAVSAHQAMQWDGCVMQVTHGPSLRLLIIGAGQITRFLAPLAISVGYKVFVCDPREEYTQTWDLPHTTLLTDMPDDAVASLNMDANTAVIALTHDPKLDDLALMEALRSPAFYVGALGSDRNQTSRKDRLKTHFEFNDEELARLHGPIGLRIGSRTPPEIAVSIMAEMIAIRHQR